MKAIHLHIPTKSVDLSNKQLLYVSELFLSGCTEAELLLKAFLYFAGIKILSNAQNGDVYFVSNTKPKIKFILNAEQLAQMIDKCRFLLSIGELKPIKRLPFTFAISRNYRLYNACFEEYLIAENYFFAYTNTRNPIYLDFLVSTLYRSRWQKWDADKVQSRAGRFKRVQPAVKYSVFLWYAGFRSYVSKRCKTLFSVKGSGGSSFNPRNYINNMIHQLTNGNIVDREKLLSQPVWAALDELEQRALENERITSNIKK